MRRDLTISDIRFGGLGARLPRIGATVMALALGALLSAQAAEVGQWEVFETSYKTSKVYPNPFSDVEVDVVFTLAEKQWVMPAFWAGGDTWKVRFAAPTQGEYQYRVQCTDKANAELNGKAEKLKVKAYQGSNPLLKHGFLQVSSDKRHFEHADGTPFFWLGDTWWKGLCKRLTWEGFQELTADRKAKGFSVVQIVCGPYPDEGLFETRWENEGGKPYTTGDFSVVNPKYFEYSDRRLKHLVDNGIVPAIVGGWGRGDCDGMKAGVPGLKRHWRNVVARYGAYPTIWIIGGESKGPQWTEVAKYVQTIDPYHRPATIHPEQSGRSSVTDESVINFDMLQTGHGDWDAARGAIPKMQAAYVRTPPMPVVIGEYCYEGHMQTGFQDIQRYVFWGSMLSGAAGHTYGAAGIWHASVEGDPGTANIYDRTTWRQGMNFPGSTQLGIGKKLLEEYPWSRFEPHPEWAEGECFAAGISNEVRLIYQPRRNIYNWTGTIVRKLEPNVPYHVCYFDPVTARRFDKGTVMYVPAVPPFNGHTEPLLFEDRFENGGNPVWQDCGTPTRRENGRLIAGKGMLTISQKVNAKDLMVSVEADSNAEAGIVLRYHDADNYLVGLYSPLLKAIFLHDRKNGQWGEMLGKVDVPEVAARIELTAAASGEYAALVLKSGQRTYSTLTSKVTNTQAGKTGLWMYQIGDRQEFAKFAVSGSTFAPPKSAADASVHVINTDEFRAPNVPSPQDWVLILQKASELKDWAARTYNDGQGHALPYRWFVPKTADDAKKIPLILYLHGAGGRGTDNIKQLVDVPQSMVFAEPTNQRMRPCFILAPQCPDNLQWVNMPWSEPAGAGKFTSITWPTQAALALLDSLLREYPAIDSSRLYIMGPSMGGYGTWDVVCRFPNKFKAAVPICGGGDPTRVSQVAGLKGLRLWAFHCADDPAVPVGRTREMIDAMKALNGIQPRYTEFPNGGHDAYSRALTDINLHQWMFDVAGAEPPETVK